MPLPAHPEELILPRAARAQRAALGVDAAARRRALICSCNNVTKGDDLRGDRRRLHYASAR